MHNIQGAAHQDYRPDIDGLRAIAVLAVVIFHYMPSGMGGGFVGVDMFFVISGYLISGIILRELEHDDFSFAGFYARRVRRIFPALALVLATTIGFGWLFIFPADLALLGKQLAGGAAFVSNFVLWRESGYFDESSQTKPLLHLWSLAIEEQFYIFWPLILWCGWKMGKGVLALVLLLLAGSFVLNVVSVQSSTGGVAAFYSPASRAWELLVGACLAAIASVRPDLSSQEPGKTTDLRSIMGAALLVLGFALIREGRQFPGWWALLPTLGTALLISAGPRALVNRVVLRLRPLVWVGLISYPLYLWHWPLLVFARLAVDAEPSRALRGALIVLSILLAWATQRLLEKPIRYNLHRRRVTAGLAVSIAVVGAVGMALWLDQGVPSRFPLAIQELAKVYVPSAEWREGTCFLRPEQDASDFAACTSDKNSGKPVLLLWGDSAAAQLYPGYQEFFSSYAIVQRTASACPPLLDTTFVDRPACRDINSAVLRSIPSIKPSRVVLAAHWNNKDWSKVQATVAALKSAGVDEIDLIGPEPEWTMPLRQVIYREYKASRLHEIPTRTHDGQRSESVALDKAMAAFASRAGVNYVSSRSILCDSRGCLTLIDGQATAWDRFHLSLAGTRFLVGRFPGAIPAH